VPSASVVMVALMVVMMVVTTAAQSEPSTDCLQKNTVEIEACLKKYLSTKRGDVVYYMVRLSTGSVLSRKEQNTLRKKVGGDGWACLLEAATECLGR